jgi:hypothetical protein
MRMQHSVPSGASEPLHSLLYRYFFFDWLFSDVSRGSAPLPGDPTVISEDTCRRGSDFPQPHALPAQLRTHERHAACRHQGHHEKGVEHACTANAYVKAIQIPLT